MKVSGGELKRCGDHADDHIRGSAQRQRAADRSRRGAEFTGPEVLADERHRRRARFVLGGNEHPAKNRLHSQQREEAGRHHLDRHAFRLSGSNEVERVGAVGGKMRKRTVAARPVEKVRIRRRVPRLVGGAPIDGDQPIRCRIGQRIEQDTVDHRKDRGVDADAERERGDGDQGEAAVLAQTPHRVLHVLAHIVRPGDCPHLAVGFLRLRDSAEVADRGEPRLLARQSSRHVVVGRFLEMARNLVVHGPIPASRSRHRRHSLEQPAQRRHDASSAIRKKRSTMPVARCHCAASSSSCFRPARVSE